MLKQSLEMGEMAWEKFLPTKFATPFKRVLDASSI